MGPVGGIACGLRGSVKASGTPPAFLKSCWVCVCKGGKHGGEITLVSVLVQVGPCVIASPLSTKDIQSNTMINKHQREVSMVGVDMGGSQKKKKSKKIGPIYPQHKMDPCLCNNYCHLMNSVFSSCSHTQFQREKRGGVCKGTIKVEGL